MAPEFPPSIVTLDLRIEGDQLRGTLEYVESANFEKRFQVNWGAIKVPKGYRESGGGVAYVYDETRELQIFPVNEQVVVTSLGNRRYLWSEGLQSGCPSMMCILILPAETTIVDPVPKPIGTKAFADRIAVYWMLRSSEQERFAIEWTLKPMESTVSRELELINRSYLSSRPAQRDFITIEDSSSKLGNEPKVANRTRPAELPAENSVFLVHGHDEAVVQTFARFVEQLGVRPVILHEQTNRGMTVIEKFEDFANRAGFAIILMKPDDQGHAVASPRKKMYRPRQNVILELGYFAAKLGRNRTFVLKKGDIEIPSDLLGLVYEPMDNANGWKLRLARELKAAGFQIDLNRAIV